MKGAPTSETVLTHYNPCLPVESMVNASPYGLGAVIMYLFLNCLCLCVTNIERTRKASRADRQRSFPIMFELKRFHLYLYGRHFTMQMDHKPLEGIFRPKTAIPLLAAMPLQRWAIILSAFNYSIKSVPSKQNALASCSAVYPVVMAQ